MYRRALLVTLGVAGAGCLAPFDSAGPASPTATSRLERDDLSAHVTAVTYDGTAGENEEGVSLSVDCDARRATLNGWFSTSSCRTVAIRSLQYDADERRAELVLFPRWTESEPPGSVDCAGASYQYQIEFRTQESLPTLVNVSYERPDNGGSTGFTARASGCL